jgi:predicted nucleic acid-binding protein
MRATLNIDDELIQEASKLTGIVEKTALVWLGRQSLITLEMAKGLLNSGGPKKSYRRYLVDNEVAHEMVLVVTSVWVAHLRAGHTELEALLNDGAVFCHPFVIGELACGNIRDRSEILTLLQALPMAEFVEHEDVMKFIETRYLMDKGLGYVDAAILSSSILILCLYGH